MPMAANITAVPASAARIAIMKRCGAIDAARTSFMVRTSASGKRGSTDCIAPRRLAAASCDAERTMKTGENQPCTSRSKPCDAWLTGM